MPTEFLEALLVTFELDESQARQLLLGWARAAPTVLVVPAFGLRAVPLPTRLALGLALALALPPGSITPRSEWPWGLQLLGELLTGLPVAVSAAIAIWVATMAGGVVDNLRQGRETAALPHVERGATPVGALLAMFAALAFLQSGGPERVVRALARASFPNVFNVASLVAQLSAGIEIAVAVAAPVLGLAMIVEVVGALVTRAANPAFVSPVLAPLRSIALLAVVALVFDRMAELLTALTTQVPR